MIEFKPTRLMIKRHTVTGLRYFCKSAIEKYERYKGSGLHWERHIKKHGTKHVITEWASDPFADPNDIAEFALLFSELHDIVKSKSWANMKPENGLDGGGPGPGEEGAKKLRATFNDPVWKATTGKIKAEKAKEGFKKTTSDPEWQATTGKQMKENQSKAGKGKPKSEQHCANIKKAQELNGGNARGIKQSAESIRKRVEKVTGQKRDPSVGRKISAALKGNKPWCTGIPQPIVTCPHCSKQGGDRNMKRYHFDKCKVLINTV